MGYNYFQGLYYSYFKSIAESRNFDEGVHKIHRDNLSEYPNIINAESKYNLGPEVSYIYKLYFYSTILRTSMRLKLF